MSQPEDQREQNPQDTNDLCLRNHIVASYQSLRIGLAVVAFAMPLVLWLGGWWSHHLDLQSSMSSYYHASPTCCGDPGPEHEGVMRDWFVGFLFAIGFMLYFYKGVTFLEECALNIAGAMACAVALIPMGWPPAHFPSKEFHSYPHSIVSILLFLCMAYVCIWRASDTVALIPNDERQAVYKRRYKWIGRAMVASPLLAVVAHSLLDHSGDHRSFTFFLEAAGAYVFAFYWVVKTKEIFESEADIEFAKGRVKAADHSVRDAFNPIEILRVDTMKGAAPVSSKAGSAAK